MGIDRHHSNLVRSGAARRRRTRAREQNYSNTLGAPWSKGGSSHLFTPPPSRCQALGILSPVPYSAALCGLMGYMYMAMGYMYMAMGYICT